MKTGEIMMEEIWLKQGDHFAVKRYDERDDIGILYLPEGSQIVHSGDVIILDDAGVYRLGNCSAEGQPDGFPALDLSGISADILAESAQADDHAAVDEIFTLPGSEASNPGRLLEKAE